MPTEMKQDKLKKLLDKSREEMQEQRSKNPGTYVSDGMEASVLNLEDPDMSEDETLEDEAKVEIWSLLPQLKNVPQSTLKKLPLSAIFQLSNALAKNSKLADKMSTSSRLAQNAQDAMKNPKQVASGLDNRRNLLHEGRFLGGACCSAVDLWLRGGEVVGRSGPMPIGNYDLDAVGCGGCVTATGWREIHDPSSQALRIKHFFLPNVAGSSLSTKKFSMGEGGEEMVVGDSLKEINDMEGYKGALNALREAMASALPWNRSVSAIVGFMVNTNYLNSDLGSNSKRASILAEFTDYILGRNGQNWENGASFISTDEMAHVWANWKAKRTALFITKEKQEKKGRERTGRPVKSDACSKYNVKTCPKQAEKDCHTFFGAKLRHVCNKWMPNGTICGKDHPRVEHV